MITAFGFGILIGIIIAFVMIALDEERADRRASRPPADVGVPTVEETAVIQAFVVRVLDHVDERNMDMWHAVSFEMELMKENGR